MSESLEPSRHTSASHNGPASNLTDPTALVGRDQERSEVDRLLEDARRGRSDSLVLRGEAGMGKTALLGYAADHAAGLTVLRATGFEGESDLAFAGLHALLWPIVAGLPELPEPQRAALAAALGLATGGGPDRFLVSAGALSLLAAAAEVRPVLCLIDDVQWLDVPSLAAVVFVARRLMAEGIAILMGVRESGARTDAETGLPELVLGPLDPGSAEHLLTRVSPSVAPHVRDRLLSEAGGNPLALLELSTALSDEQMGGGAPLPDALPLTTRLRGVFMRQINGLPAAAQSALLLASAENEGELPVIRRAAATMGLPEDALESAEEAGLVSTDDRMLVFRHPLVRSVVYGSAPLGPRQRAHRSLADALENADRTDRAVWHRAVATDGPDEDLAGELEASAHRSRELSAHASAASALERAAMLSETESSRGRRLAEAANAAYRGGQLPRAQELVRRAQPVAEPAGRAHLLGLSGVIKGFSGSLQDGISTLLEAISFSQDASLSLELLREACAMATYIGDADQLMGLSLRAAELAPATDHDRFIVAMLTAAAAELEGDFLRAQSLSADAIELAERCDDARCLLSVASTAGRAGNWGDGLPYANRAVRIARERGFVSTLPYALQAQASQLVGQGQFDLGYISAEEGRRLALDLGQPWVAAWNLGDLLTADSLRGDQERFGAHLAELEAIVRRSGGSLVTARITRALGMLDLSMGRPAAALERLLVSLQGVRPESVAMVVHGHPDVVEAAVRAQRLDLVMDHVERFQDWVQRYPNRARLALLERCLAMVDEPSAEPHHVRALEYADALWPFDRARSELLYGEWLRRHRRRADARKHLRAAMQTFGALGLPPWEERARSELRASGETARRRDVESRDLLTTQELQIARMVAAGMSNPEVAAQLFLSPRTIDYHLRKVFAKLEIASRSELAGAQLGESAAA